MSEFSGRARLIKAANETDLAHKGKSKSKLRGASDSRKYQRWNTQGEGRLIERSVWNVNERSCLVSFCHFPEIRHLIPVAAANVAPLSTGATRGASRPRPLRLPAA